MGVPPFLLRIAAASAILFVIYFVILRDHTPQHVKPPPRKSSFTEGGSKILVMGRLGEEDTDWVEPELPDWQRIIYTVDTVNQGYKSVPANKGREAMVYLTYIVDHYDALPETMVFTHSHRQAWHTDSKDQDIVTLLQDLNLAYIQQEGYANLRCQWNPGCTAGQGLSLLTSTSSSANKAASVLSSNWDKIFIGGMKKPDLVAGTCCSQFAVSKETVLRRGREEYVQMRWWLMNSGVESDTMATVFEHLWQVIFGWNSVFCPNVDSCYCNLYGQCKGPRKS